MPRCPHEEADVLAAFARWRTAHPDSGFVIGFIEVGAPGEPVVSRVADVGCELDAFVAHAASCLRVASDIARQSPPSPARTALVMRIEAALAPIDGSPERLAS